jgi:hypothetical protein
MPRTKQTTNDQQKTNEPDAPPSVPSLAESTATEMDLPPRGFLLLVMTQRIQENITNEQLKRKIEDYMTALGNNRKADAAVREMSQFVGSLNSVASFVAPLLYTR